MTYDLAIIVATVDVRQPLLDRAIHTWCDDIAASGLNVAIRIFGDGCDPLSATVAEAAKRCDVKTYSSPQTSGSNYLGYNTLVAETDADVYLFTHPEVMFPLGTIATAHEQAVPGVWVGFKIYWLPQHMTEHLNDYDFSRLEEYDDLYRLDPREKGPFYWNVNVPEIEVWESNTTYAMDAATTARLFPMPLFGKWGPDDPYQAGMRVKLGIPTITMQRPILYHQWHQPTEHPSDASIVAEASAAIEEHS
jgi:hypothetical protein